jgi:hypothetical protein
LVGSRSFRRRGVGKIVRMVGEGVVVEGVSMGNGFGDGRFKSMDWHGMSARNNINPPGNLISSSAQNGSSRAGYRDLYTDSSHVGLVVETQHWRRGDPAPLHEFVRVSEQHWGPPPQGLPGSCRVVIVMKRSAAPSPGDTWAKRKAGQTRTIEIYTLYMCTCIYIYCHSPYLHSTCANNTHTLSLSVSLSPT